MVRQAQQPGELNSINPSLHQSRIIFNIQQEIFNVKICKIQNLKSKIKNSFYLPQHFLNFFPLPHGQGSLRPTLG